MDHIPYLLKVKVYRWWFYYTLFDLAFQNIYESQPYSNKKYCPDTKSFFLLSKIQYFKLYLLRTSRACLRYLTKMKLYHRRFIRLIFEIIAIANPEILIVLYFRWLDKIVFNILPIKARFVRIALNYSRSNI